MSHLVTLGMLLLSKKKKKNNNNNVLFYFTATSLGRLEKALPRPREWVSEGPTGCVTADTLTGTIAQLTEHLPRVCKASSGPQHHVKAVGIPVIPELGDGGRRLRLILGYTVSLKPAWAA